MKLVDSPRGRDVLMEIALAAVDTTDHTLHSALFHATRPFETSNVTYYTSDGGSSAPSPDWPDVTPGEVATLLEGTPLVEPGVDMLLSSVASAVDNAAYWQPPSGWDHLLATPEICAALTRVEEHLVVPWFDAPFDGDDQWELWWRDGHHDEAPAPPSSRVLRSWAEQTRQEEARRHVGGGRWWSSPPFGLPVTTTLLPDGTPAGLHFMEDSFGWNQARCRRVEVPDSPCVLEITGPQDWAGLCRRFPLEVTNQKRYNWAQCTGREGRWVVPDYEGVAEHYDAVHLTVRGYLTTAGLAVPVDEGRASVLAGWAPEETYWFRDIAAGEEVRDWDGTIDT